MLTHHLLPVPSGLFLASGPPVKPKLRPLKIEPGGFSQGHMSVSRFDSAQQTRGKLTEHEVPGGTVPTILTCSTGRPLTFPPGDQYLWRKIGGERTY
jgi:hypothetical protein